MKSKQQRAQPVEYSDHSMKTKENMRYHHCSILEAVTEEHSQVVDCREAV